MPISGLGHPAAHERAHSHPSTLSWLCSLQEDDETSQCSADFDLSLPDNGFMSKNEVIRSKVSRLTERLRKRYPSNNFGKAQRSSALQGLCCSGDHCIGNGQSGEVPAKAVLIPSMTSSLHGEDISRPPRKGKDEKVQQYHL